MSEHTSSERKRRRKELAESLPALSQKRTDTYRLNSDALALDRAGVKHQGPQEKVRLGENEAAADAAIRDAQREIRHLDAQIQSASGLGARVGRAARRVRGRG
jgi:hypothetical protein